MASFASAILKWFLLCVGGVCGIFLLCALLVSLTTETFECGKFYASWACLQNCYSTNQSSCSDEVLPFDPFSGYLNCTKHKGERGIDSRRIRNIIQICLSLVSALSDGFIAFALRSSELLPKHLTLVVNVACCEAVWMITNVIVSIVDIMRVSAPTSPFSPKSTLLVWGWYFFYLSSIFWHTAIVCCVYLLTVNPVAFTDYFKSKFTSPLVFSLALGIALPVYLTNSVGFISNNVFLLTGVWFTLFQGVVYGAFGWACFVIACTMYRLRQQLSARLVNSVSALVGFIVVYYTPSLCNLVIYLNFGCVRSGFWRATFVLDEAAMISACGLANLCVWWSYIFKERKSLESPNSLGQSLMKSDFIPEKVQSGKLRRLSMMKAQVHLHLLKKMCKWLLLIAVGIGILCLCSVINVSAASQQYVCGEHIFSSWACLSCSTNGLTVCDG
jgi:hypothetical protein